MQLDPLVSGNKELDTLVPSGLCVSLQPHQQMVCPDTRFDAGKIAVLANLCNKIRFLQNLCTAHAQAEKEFVKIIISPQLSLANWLT